ncbi:MAG: TM0996/MTH895 family glutaredoxin-like protein [Candidatus Aminicenantes bacterium]|nr:TM0996/MTH895 family glutaredoxin-like protein [Candidatus Aminicenantes bacterium]
MIKIQILGMGCPKCKKLASNADQAARTLGLDCEIVKVTGINEITKMGVMLTPGLAINGEVQSTGKVLNSEEIIEILKTYKSNP